MHSATLTIVLTLIPTLCVGYLKPRDGVASLPSCAITCALASAQGTKCTNPADVSCSCNDQEFRAKMTDCVVKGCDADAQMKTYTISQSLCTGGSSPTPPEVTPTPSAPAPAETSAATPPHSTPETPAPAQPVTSNPDTVEPDWDAPEAQNGTAVDSATGDAPAPTNGTAVDTTTDDAEEPDWDAPAAENTSETCSPAVVVHNGTATNASALNATIATPLPSNSSATQANATASTNLSSNTDEEDDSTSNASSYMGGLSATIIAAAFFAAVSLPSFC